MSAFGVGEALAAVVDLGQCLGWTHPPGRLNLFRCRLGISMVTSKFTTPPLGHVDD
jgi:hypothetical protein